MPTLDEMYADLASADKIGDKEIAARIATKIRATEAAANPVGPPVPKPADVPDMPVTSEEMAAGAAEVAPTPGAVQKEIDATTAANKAKAAQQKEAVDSIRLRLPNVLGGADIPFVPQAVSKLLVGNTAQVADIPLALKQRAAATFGIGDKEALAKEVAQKEAAEAPLKEDRWGGMGAVAGRMIPEAAAVYAGGPALKAVEKGVAAIPLVPKFVSKLAKYATPGAVFNQANTSKDEDAGIGTQAGWGAAQNIAGEGLGSIAGRVVRPIMKDVGELAASGVKGLKESPMGDRLTMLATNLSDVPWIKDATDSLSKLPGWGGKINAARAGNLTAWTEEASARTGTKMKVPTTENMQAMWKNLNDTGNSFRTQTEVKVGDIPKALEPAVEVMRGKLAAAGDTALLSKFERMLGGFADTTKKGALLDASGKPIMNTTEAKFTTSDLMDLRRSISDKIQTTDPFSDARAAMRALRDHIDTKIRDAFPMPKTPAPGATADGFRTFEDVERARVARAHTAAGREVPTAGGGVPDVPKGQHPFDKWREQWGNAEDFSVAVSKMDPKVAAANPKDFPLSERGEQGTPKDAFEKMTLDARRQFHEPPGGENRSAWTRVLGGALPVAANVASFGAAPALANKLLGSEWGGKYLTSGLRGQKELAELLRQGGRIGGATFGNTRD